MQHLLYVSSRITCRILEAFAPAFPLASLNRASKCVDPLTRVSGTKSLHSTACPVPTVLSLPGVAASACNCPSLPRDVTLHCANQVRNLQQLEEERRSLLELAGYGPDAGDVCILIMVQRLAPEKVRSVRLNLVIIFAYARRHKRSYFFNIS